jgi:hypothetical protein
MTPKEEWRDILSRLRFERTKYAKMAAQRRKDATALRKRRDFLGALEAMSRANEYSRYRDHRTVEIDKIRKEWGFR